MQRREREREKERVSKLQRGEREREKERVSSCQRTVRNCREGKRCVCVCVCVWRKSEFLSEDCQKLQRGEKMYVCVCVCMCVCVRGLSEIAKKGERERERKSE